MLLHPAPPNSSPPSLDSNTARLCGTSNLDESTEAAKLSQPQQMVQPVFVIPTKARSLAAAEAQCSYDEELLADVKACIEEYWSSHRRGSSNAVVRRVIIAVERMGTNVLMDLPSKLPSHGSVLATFYITGIWHNVIFTLLRRLGLKDLMDPKARISQDLQPVL